MKKLLLLLLISVSLNSCIVYYKYVSEVTEPVEGKIKTDSFEFESLGMLSCNSVGYKITNLTNSNIDIDWNRASLIIEGEAFRLHEGNMKGLDINKEQLFMRIPPKSFKKGVMISGREFKFVSGYGYQSDCLYKEKEAIGKTFSIRFPIIYNDIIKDYELKVKIKDMVKIKNPIITSDILK